MSTNPSTSRRAWLRILAVLAAIGLVLGACGNSGDEDEGATETEDTADDGETTTTAGETEGNGEFQPIEGVPGVTDEAINFAVLSTGPANPLGYCLLECVVDGLEAYFAFRNDQGGVNGRELVVSEIVDDELGSNQVKALELTQNQDVFGVVAFPIIAAGIPDLASAEIPTYTSAVQSAEADGNDTIFPWPGVVCTGCPSRSVVYLAQLAEATKVASIGYGVSEASKTCVEAHERAFELWGEDAGVEFVYSKNDLPYGLPNGLGPEVSAMKDAGVDFVLTCIDQNGALILSQELERQGMGDAPIVLPQGYADDTFVGSNAELLEGDYLSLQYRPLEADAGESQLDEFKNWMEETGGQVSDYSYQGWIVGELIFQGILSAGPEFDRAKVVSATNGITDDTGAGLKISVDWSRQHSAPTPEDPVTNGSEQSCFAAVRVADGDFELVGDAAAPWFCWDPADPSWSEPTATNFE